MGVSGRRRPPMVTIARAICEREDCRVVQVEPLARSWDSRAMRVDLYPCRCASQAIEWLRSCRWTSSKLAPSASLRVRMLLSARASRR